MTRFVRGLIWVMYEVFRLQEELIAAGVLPADIPVTYADTTPLERDFGFKPHT